MIAALAPVAGAAAPKLVECHLSSSATQPGYGVELTCEWESTPLAGEYSVFVHVRDASGIMVAQADHAPPVPTSQWSGRVRYTEAISIPPTVAPGEYTVVVGLWDGKALRRIAVEPGAGLTLAEKDAVRVGTVKVDSAAALPTLPAPSLNLDDYRQTFAEEFSGGELSVSPWGPGTRWIAHTPFNLDFGDAAFADPAPGFPFTLREGKLRIEARQAEGKWRSGLLASVDREGRGFAQKFGYFEIRAKLPKGEGLWPAFWLMGLPGLKDKTITNLEIDVLEQYGARPNTLWTTLHWWGPEKAHRSSARGFIVPGMTDDFHRYGVLVTEQEITFYYDRVELRRMPTPPEGKVPLYILLDLALGGGWPSKDTPNPSFLSVDYVRAYAR